MQEGNAIVVPLEIKLDKLKELEETIQKLRETEKTIPQGANPKSPGLSVYGWDDSVEKAFENFFGNAVGTTPQAGMNNAMQIFRNPQAWFLGLLTNPYILAAFAAAGGAKFIQELLTMHGGIFDLHFKRVVTDENIKGRSRQDKEAVRVGIGRSVVITSHSGRNTPEYAFNSFEAVRSGEMENIKAFQIRKGYKF